MSLTPTKRNNPCPVCEDTSGKCRQGREDADYWQCMTYADAKKGEVISGYKCIGTAKDGMWGQFKPDNTYNNIYERTEQQRSDWKLENQRRQQQKAKVDDERRRRSLSVADRDKGYRQMLDELTLHPDDRADLVRRGFTAAQIELSGFRSIGRYQQLQGQYSELLPGINRSSRIVIREEGYLCPIRNQDSFIVACQVRLRTLPSTESNRYRWLSGDSQTLHLFPDGCKSDGELPLAVFQPEGKPEGIALVEGVGAKPFLVSQRLNLFTIGAAGGQLASSPELVKQALQSGTKETDSKTLFIFPDAGDIVNRHVMTRWQRVVELVESLGYEVRFAWWNQVSKGDRDIDELKDFSTIQYISPHEFFSLGQPSTTPQGFGSSDDTPVPEAGTMIFVKSSSGSGITTWSKKVVEAPKKLDDTPERKRKAWENWLKHRSFTNTIKSNSQYFDAPIPEAGTMIFVKSGLGSGKTTWSKKVVEELRKQDVEGFFSLGYRNPLLIQLAEILGFHHIHDKENRCMWSESGSGITLCVDSLLKFSPESFDNKVILIDEICSVIKHLLHSSTVKNRDKILELFTEAIRRSRQVICLDGMMTDLVVNYLHAICPEKQIIKYENTYKGDKAPVNFLLGTVSEGEECEKIKVNDRSPIVEGILDFSDVSTICSDSQAFLEAIDNLLVKKGKKPLRVDSKTVPEKHIKELLRNSNQYLEANKGKTLLYSPLAESGLDVSVKNYFNNHFAVFYGVLDIDGMMQMLGRIRDSKVPKFVWCKSFISDDEKINTKSLFIEKIEKSLNESLMYDITSSLGDSEWQEATIAKITENLSKNIINNRLSATLKAMENFEKSNLRECLRYALVDAGYDVTDYNPESNDYSKIAKEEVEEVKKQNSADIFNAKDIDIEKSDELAFDATWEKRCEVAKAKLFKRLPGIKETPVWSADFVYLTKYKNRNFIEQQEMYWLINHPEYAKEEASKNLHWMIRKNAGYIGNYKSRWAKISAMLEIGLLEFAHSEDEWLDHSPELIVLCEKAKNYKNALGLQGKLSNIQFLGRLLKSLGLKLEKRKIGKKVRCYHISQDGLTDPNRIETLAAIERKFTQKESEPLVSGDWKIALDEANGILPENSEETASDMDIRLEQMKIEIAIRREQGKKKREFEQRTKTGHYQPLKQLSPNAPKSDFELLVEQLELCQNAEEFQKIAYSYNSEKLEDAILFANNKHLLRTWRKAVDAPRGVLRVSLISAEPEALPKHC